MKEGDALEEKELKNNENRGEREVEVGNEEGAKCEKKMKVSKAVVQSDLKFYAKFYNSLYSAKDQDDVLKGEHYLIFDKSKP